MVIDKALSLMKFVKLIKETLNENPDFFRSTKDIQYSYLVKVVDEIGDEVSKFTLGIDHGKMQMCEIKNADVIIALTENAFFSLLRGKDTLEALYFAGEADLWSRDGHAYSHAIGIKSAFQLLEKAVRENLGDV